MSQEFYDAEGGDGDKSIAENFRLISSALVSLRQMHAGTVEPTTTSAYMLWGDTTLGVIKIRNAADTAWIVVAPLLGSWSTPPKKSISFADSPYTISDGEGYFLEIDCTGGAVTINLPDCATNGELHMGFYKSDASGNGVTINRAGSDTIEGATTLMLAGQYNDARLRSFAGTDWLRVD